MLFRSYEDLSIDFGRINKHPKSRYGVQTRLRALLEPAINFTVVQARDSLACFGNLLESNRVFYVNS